MAAALYTLSNVAGVGAWLSGPARVAFVIGLDRYFPPAFGKVHPRFRTPYVAILVQAVLATVFLLISQLGKGSTVEHAYLVLLDTQLLVYFIPYVYLFLCLLRQARGPVQAGQLPGGRAGATLAGVCGLAITVFAMIVASIPPSDAPDRFLFGVKVIGGAGAFVALGALIYWRARGSSARLTSRPRRHESPIPRRHPDRAACQYVQARAATGDRRDGRTIAEDSPDAFVSTYRMLLTDRPNRARAGDSLGDPLVDLSGRS